MSFLYAFGDLLGKVLAKNRDDKNVKTAEKSVFDEVQKKVEQVEAQDTQAKSRGDILREYREKILEAQQENEVNPEVETAPRSVYDDLMAEVEKMREQEEQYNREQVLGRGGHDPIRVLDDMPTPQPTRPTQSSMPNLGAQAVTNSMGGSLAMRAAPDMGAQQSNLRIPDKSLLRILQYSDNAIHLDGRRSRFVLVDYKGQQGWVLENYLNFN
jgi:CCR4-NOT transcriptional regulation complex NOT5 subunit